MISDSRQFKVDDNAAHWFPALSTGVMQMQFARYDCGVAGKGHVSMVVVWMVIVHLLGYQQNDLQRKEWILEQSKR